MLKKAFLLFLFSFINILTLNAADNICAEVQISIKQEVSFERQGFEAHMKITNGAEGLPITDIAVELIFSDENENTVLASSNSNETTPGIRFFYRLDDDQTNITGSLNAGTAYVDGGTFADIYWLIIPTRNTDNTSPQGKLYFVGAKLSYKIAGNENETKVIPDYIYVLPTPALTLDYFLPEIGNGDDPNTQKIEASKPFTLGLRVLNNGYGTAKNLNINSAQPKIIDNSTGLLIGFSILDAWVNGNKSNSGLKLNFGNLESQKIASACWKLEATLDGRFKEFTADFTHSDALGGQLTSLIDSVNTHTLIHDVLVDIPGRDQICDFLASDAPNHKLFSSENFEPESVSDYSSSTVFEKKETTDNREHWSLTFPAVQGHSYTRVNDLYNGEKIILNITRSDGKKINSQNFWKTRTSTGNGYWNYHICLFDTNTTGKYDVVYDLENDLLHPPVIQYITDKTVSPVEQISFIVEASDEDGDDINLSAAGIPDGASFYFKEKRGLVDVYIFDWVPTLEQIGEYTLTFKASDSSSSSERKMNITVGSGGYRLDIENGTGDGNYPKDEVVTISADVPEEGFFFDCWSGDDVSYIEDIHLAETSLSMPDKNISISATYKAADPNAPVLHWAMDETQGNTLNDYSPNGYIGNITGTPVWLTEGTIENALNFDGIENYVTSNFSEMPEKWTIGLWLKTEDFAEEDKTVSVISKGTDIKLDINNTAGKLNASASTVINDQKYTASFGTIYPDTWYHFLVEFDGSSLKTYKNGVPTVSTVSTVSTVPHSGESLILGGNETNNLFAGIMDDLRIYNRILDDTEIDELIQEANVLLAANNTYTVNEDAQLNVDSANGLLNNDKAPDNNTLTVSLISEPGNGMLSLNYDGSFEYIPNENFNGSDSFTYLVKDEVTEGTAKAEAFITVEKINDAPVANDDLYKIGRLESLNVIKDNGLTANDSNIDGGKLSVNLVENVKQGILNLSGDGSFEYIPDENFTGIDSFTYKLNNGLLDSETAEVKIVLDSTEIIENFESGNIDSWNIYDNNPAGTVEIIDDIDDTNNKVTALSGEGTSTGFRYTFSQPIVVTGLSGEASAETDLRSSVVQWRMKYSEPYIVYFSCQTKNGHRYIYYTAADKDNLGSDGYIHHGLGKNTTNGQWVTIRRNLEKDLLEAQPDNELISIDAFLIRGSGLIDDITLLDYIDTDYDLIPDYVETEKELDPENPDDAAEDKDNDGLSNYDEFILGTDISNADTDNDGLPDYYELYSTGTNPLLKDSDGNSVDDSLEDSDSDGICNFDEYLKGLNPLKETIQGDGYVYDQTVYDIAGNDTLGNWVIYDNDPEGVISITPDPDFPDNNVIKLSTDGGTATGFRYTFPSLQISEFKIHWRMKYCESYIVYISCMTTEGYRYIYYTASDKNNLGADGYVHHGLGKNTINGQWVDISRDLQKDLEEAQPGNKIIYIDAFLVRGAGLIGSISTVYFADIDKDSLPDEFEINKGLDPVNSADADNDMDNDGISNIDEFNMGTDLNNPDSDNDGLNDYIEKFILKTDPLKMDSDNNGIPDGNEDYDGDGFSNLDEINAGTDPAVETKEGENFYYDIIMHEDAESGNTLLWDVYDNNPVGTVTNIADSNDPDNRLICLSGDKTATGYRCTFGNPVSDMFKIQWRMKYSETFQVFVSCMTSAGHRYIYYTPSDNDNLGTDGYVHHGLGKDAANGEWITVRRDLMKDLQDAQPDNTIISVDALLIRGSGFIDDICSLKYIDSDRDLIPDNVETAHGLDPYDYSDAESDSDNDGLSNIDEFISGLNMSNPDSDSDGLTDGYETSVTHTDPLKPDSDNDDVPDGEADSDDDGISNTQEAVLGSDPFITTHYDNITEKYYETTVHENAESADITLWDVYDNNPEGTIAIITDPDDLANKVVSLSGDKTSTGFRCTFSQPLTVSGLQSTTVRWRMKYRESYIIYFSCQTKNGHRYIYYTASDKNNLGTAGYVHHGLGKDTVNDEWIAFERNLQDDLKEAQPDNELTSVDAFLIRGSGLVDDITTTKYFNK